MITNRIVQPKIAVTASLLIGVLAIAAFTLRPEMGPQLAEQSGFGRGDAALASAPDDPRPTALASGKVSVQSPSDVAVALILDAVRESLRRNDLASAKVLLDAEQVLYRDDPRFVALQKELQAREEAGGEVRAAEPTVASPAPSLPSQSAPRYVARTEHPRSASAGVREHVSRRPEYAERARAPQVEATANPVVTRGTPNRVPTNPAPDLAALRAAPSTAEAPSPSQSTALPAPSPQPPLTQAVQSELSTPSKVSTPVAQTDPTPTSVASPSNQGPKTRAEVRMEVERARTNGALPRFGNPDPAGPGGAPSRISHEVMLN